MGDGAGRDGRGRFAQGWRGGPGRPKRQVEEDYLEAFRRAVSIEDMVAIVETAVAQARDGNGRARDFIARYLLPETSCVASGGGAEQRFIVHIPAGVRSAGDR
jgi:hypothetical protein